ncbi:MAG: serine hydrolase [Gemmatimonadota bacterium]|nr:MAG: serine hydrolase [Gemmatimonadota bacterium]
MQRLILSIVGLALAAPCLAQQSVDPTNPRVQEALHLLGVWIEAQRAYEQIPGVSVAVVHDQDLLWSAGFGYADREAETPATAETQYSICSISKLFTSVAVMQLRDQGKLRLDDPVGRHLSWFDIQDTYPDGPPVTVQGILTHSSGLPRESDYPYWSPPDFPFPTHDELVARLREQRELYPGATWYQYSNLGLTLAGEIVTALSGEPYGAYERRHILDPLGMAHTTPAIAPDDRLASGYTAMTREGRRERLPLFTPRGIAPAMGFASTVEDLAKFASWQFRVLYHGANEVLGRNTLREMQRVHWLDPDWSPGRGLGFGVWRSNDKTFVGHGGSCPGYRSQLTLQVDDRLATIFMANANGVNAGAFAQQAQQIMAPALAAAADTTRLDPAFARYLGTYSELPWSGEAAVIPWKGKLAVLYLPTTDPLDALMKLEHVEGHTFRRIRDDGSLGEEIRFDVDDAGRVLRMWQHSNFSPKVR